MRIVAKKEHEVAYQDLVALVNRHAADLTAAEVLAIAANMLGKLIAMQDQRTMTAAKAMEIVQTNMEIGNAEVVKELSNTKGSA